MSDTLRLIESAAQSLAEGFPMSAKALAEDAVSEAHAAMVRPLSDPASLPDASAERARRQDERARAEYVLTFVARVAAISADWIG